MDKVKAEWFGDAFERSIAKAIEQQLVKSASILRKNLSTALGSAGNSSGGNPPSPDGSSIPFADTGNLARSWFSSSKIKRKSSGKYVAEVYSNLMYAYFLVSKTGKGQRNYMEDGLYWRENAIAHIKKQLSAEKIIGIAKRQFKF